MVEYINRVKQVVEIVTELSSEAQVIPGIEAKGFESIGMVEHYSPPCPQSHLTLANKRHTDPSFITILLQDQVGGLQVLYEDHWVDATLPFLELWLLALDTFFKLLGTTGL